MKKIKEERRKEIVENFKLFLLVDKGLKSSSSKNLSQMLNNILRTINKNNPSVNDFRKYLANVKESNYSHNYYCNMCLVIERFCESKKINVKFNRGKPPQKLPKPSLSEGEIAILLSATKNSRERAMLSILVYSGIRNNEFCNIKVKDILFDKRKITVAFGKCGSNGEVNISNKCLSDIYKYLTEYPRSKEEYLFTTSRENNQMSSTSIRRFIKRLCKRVNLNKRIYPHMLRRSLAMNMFKRNANIFAIKGQLRHRHFDTTLQYLNLMDKNNRFDAQYNLYCPDYS